MVQDIIADMLTRMRNANQMKYENVEVLGSKMTLGIAEILKREGYITDFDTNNKDERFQIKDILFKYRSNDGRLGYHKIKNDGGYILENKQYVKVEYIEHKRLGNIIVGLWVKEKKADNTKEE